MEVGDDIFPIRVRERGLTELEDNSLNKDSISETGSVVRTRLEVPSEGSESVKTGVLMDVNFENRNITIKCQKMLELENEEAETEYVSKEINMGVVDEMDKSSERALKDVRDMGLDIIEDPFGVSKEGGIDIGSSLGEGCGKGGNTNTEEFICPVKAIKASRKTKKIDVIF
ncbi:hypothetical protein J1N35_029313 [Gossypium stocksii]|uniref:Uncharacterized protein n=1 Tax=Gossypium stocksii TaxID=47602 RepID=A0A9D3ZRY2_9ROSI|nr:hypothetical protein J1N35_029313 [Gossypium stocksii]